MAAPIISNLVASDITEISMTITWDTDQAADSLVAWSLESDPTPLGSVFDATKVFSHLIPITGLDMSTQYVFTVTSKTRPGNGFTTTTTIQAGTLIPAIVSALILPTYPGTGGIFTFSRVDVFDNAISDSISQTYNSDDLSLANTDSPSGQAGTLAGGVVITEGGTDVTMRTNGSDGPITINNAGARFMR
jgi:hypothetical protein